MTDLKELESYPAAELISWAVRTHGESFAISNSFQKEDMILVDLASRAGGKFRIFTLDTGRLHEETYQMMETVRERYGIGVEPAFPDRDEVERMVAGQGPNLFYGSIEARKLCCEIRKVHPLERKLAEFQVYYNEARCHASLHGRTPFTFTAGPRAISANLNHVRWVSHCRDLVQLPVAA